jgi:hypothetical protein
VGNLRKEVMTLPKDFIIHNIDDDLHREFKAACSHYALSMRVTLIRHMQNIVNDYRKDRRGLIDSDLISSKRGKK